MTVKPDTPVKPDKIVIPFEMQTLYMVDMLVKGVRDSVYIMWGGLSSSTADLTFLTFEQSGVYKHLTVGGEEYYYDVYPECRGPICIKREYIVMYSPVSVKVADYEDISDAWRQDRARRSGYRGNLT